MSALIDVILPVFLVIGFGYVVAWRGLFSDAGVDALTRFSQYFALPCLLFRAMAGIDLGVVFDPAVIVSYYSGSFLTFAAGLAGARLMFRRPWEDSVAIAVACFFPNSLLLGLPITERAYGPDALAGNYAIIALHTPICLSVGIIAMETVRARGEPMLRLAGSVGREVLSNPLIIGILAGIAFNALGLWLPQPVWDGLDLIVRSALPTALFALGGVLFRYRPEGDLRTIGFVCVLSLVLHPALVRVLGPALDLSDAGLRSAVVTASVAPGVNTFLFATLYGVAKRVAASSVLIGTALSILTTWVWLTLLP